MAGVGSRNSAPISRITLAPIRPRQRRSKIRPLGGAKVGHFAFGRYALGRVAAKQRRCPYIWRLTGHVGPPGPIRRGLDAANPVGGRRMRWWLAAAERAQAGFAAATLSVGCGCLRPSMRAQYGKGKGRGAKASRPFLLPQCLIFKGGSKVCRDLSTSGKTIKVKSLGVNMERVKGIEPSS